MTTEISQSKGPEGGPMVSSAPNAPRQGALYVAAGIFLSRISGLVRERVFAHYFGNSAAADAFKAAQRIPNFLQNLFGEGVLSASFIPVYARLLSEKCEVEADRVAGVIATLLAIATSVMALIGVALTPLLIDVIAPGFEGERRLLTIQLVKILFPGIALLVMSAWSLGILNSHRRFFISYAAPVIWNISIIGSMLLFGEHATQNELAIKAAWGLVIGSFLQFAIQLPFVFKLLTHFRLSVDIRSLHVKGILGNFTSVVFARGVVQISAYVDNMLASLLPTGTVAILGNAQTLYLLPISVFGMSVSAASLAEMSRSRGEMTNGNNAHSNDVLRTQLERGSRHIAFFIFPSTAAYLVLGDVVVAGLFKTGKFSQTDVRNVWFALIGCSVGLLASTLGRLYASTFYALEDTKSPLRIAIIRVTLSMSLGYAAGIKLPALLGIDASWGIVCLTLASSLGAWAEFLLLRRKLNSRIGRSALPWTFLWRIGLASVVASMAGLSVKAILDSFTHQIPPYVTAIPIFGFFGAAYFGTAALLRVAEVAAITNRIMRRR